MLWTDKALDAAIAHLRLSREQIAGMLTEALRVQLTGSDADLSKEIATLSALIQSLPEGK